MVGLGFFDVFVVFLFGLGWAWWLARRPGASPWAARWGWIVGGILSLAVIAGMVGLFHGLTAPPPPLAPDAAPQPTSQLVQAAIYGRWLAYADLGLGYLALVVLTAMSFMTTDDGPPDSEPAGETGASDDPA